MSLPVSNVRQEHQGQLAERADAGEGRPYRSHKIPACDRCRKRKLRCAVDVPGQPCNSCRISGALCFHASKGSRSGSLSNAAIRHAPQISRPSNENNASRPLKRRRTESNDRSPPNQNVPIPIPPRIFSSPTQARREDRMAPPSAPSDSGSKSAMIVGPVMAEDVQLIQDFMSSQGRLHHSSHDRLYDTVSDNPQDPVVYLTVPRRRQGLSLNYRPGEKQREILEQILGPFMDEVIAL